MVEYSIMSNGCEGCPISCCVDFKITTEVVDPKRLKEELQKHPFIKRVGIEPVRGPGGKVMVVGVYRCDNFDIQKRECLIYDAERPDFCENTGQIQNRSIRPHSECIL